jgi:hypothetical protein
MWHYYYFIQPDIWSIFLNFVLDSFEIHEDVFQWNSKGY